MLLLLSQTPGVLAATAATIALSAPTADIAPGSVTLAATANTITLSAPTATLLSTLGAGTNTITLSAPTATLVPGSVTIAADANTIALSAGVAAIAFDQTAVVVTIDGTDRSTQIEMDTLEVRDLLNEAPNTCSFTCYNVTPSEGQAMSIYLGSAANTVFAGTILSVEQFYSGIRHNIGYRVTAQDYTWLLNRRLVTRRWTSTSATTIAQQIISSFTSGFTSSNVAAGLATVTEFEVVNETPARALSRLAEAIGGYWYIDYSRDLHFFLTEISDAPDAIADVTMSGDNLSHTTKGSQLRNRVVALGVDTTVTADVTAPHTSVPVQDAPADASGQMQVGANVLTFTGRDVGGTGSVAYGPLASPTAPTAAVSTASGGVVGAVKYCKIDVDDSGQSEPSAVSNTVTATTASTPSAIGSGSAQHTGSGVYDSTVGDWYTTFVSVSRSGSNFSFNYPGLVPGALIRIFGSSSGAFDGTWRVASVASGVVNTVAGISTSAPSSDVAKIALITQGELDGTYEYGVSQISSLGETAVSAALSVSVSKVSDPSPSISSTAVAGSLSAGIYYWWLTLCGVNGGETSPRLLVFGTFGASTGLQFTFGAWWSAAFADLRVASAKLYRSRVNQTTPFLVKTWTREELARGGYLHPSSVTALVYSDTIADTALGGLPANGIIGAAVGLSSIPTTSDTRCTGRRLWRKKSGVWCPLAILSDAATTTTYLDTTSDDELGLDILTTQNAFGGAAVTLTVPVGAAGTTRRIIGRTKAGGSILFHCGSLGDNTTTAFTDKKTDEDLGEPIGTFSKRRTAAGSTTLRVADLSVYPASGWVRAGSQVIYYAARSASSGEGYLTGIPASGMGAITSPISAETEVIVEPHLTGVTGLSYAINKGDRIRLYAVRNDTTAQTTRAAIEGGDGIHEHVIECPKVTTTTALQEAADAELSAFSAPLKSITFRTRDPKVRTGKTITLSMGGTTNLSGSFLIQDVEITEFHIANNTYPMRKVTAAPVQFTFQDFLRRAQLAA